MIKKTLTNEKGILTLDFIFASLLVFGLSTVIFSFGMTLSTAEVVQYMSFAAARDYSLAHLNQDKQRQRGEEHFNRLATNPIFSSLLNIGWFKVQNVKIGDFNTEYNPEVEYENFVGARIPFSAPILYKRIPLVGSTGPDPEAFQTNIQSFLGRDPTFKECQSFMSQRAQQMATRLQFNQIQVDQAAVIMDNGC